jgi:flagellar basal body-associated protein FliL
MKSLLKIIIMVGVVTIISVSVIVIVKQPRHAQAKPAPAQDALPNALSNYSKTFKLNTNPPIWQMPANGRNTNN